MGEVADYKSVTDSNSKVREPFRGKHVYLHPGIIFIFILPQVWGPPP
jgi:hypothetical protein